LILAEPLSVVAQVAGAFNKLGVRYLVGGSLASSVYGIPRATQDVDLVADLPLTAVEDFCSLLKDSFYVDGDMIRDAIARRASFNVVHLGTMFKADVFIMKGDSWSREEMSRVREETIESLGVSIRFASPEDVLLHKLIWYKLGNEISDRQWGDILGVLRVQGDLLDQKYLEYWADILDVLKLLSRALKEAK
jgi:hypothetical protein